MVRATIRPSTKRGDGVAVVHQRRQRRAASDISLGRYRYTTPHALESFIAETSNAGVSSVTGGGDRPQDSDAVASPAPFTRGDVVAATRRRQEEKERAKQYLRSQLGSRSARGASRRAASG